MKSQLFGKFVRALVRLGIGTHNLIYRFLSNYLLVKYCGTCTIDEALLHGFVHM